MAGDDRALRDRLETLQVRTKQLRAQLDDAGRLAEVRVEVTHQLATLRRVHAEALGKLARLGPEVEDARVRSMQVKREREERRGAVAATARITFALAAAFGGAAMGARLGPLLPQALACAACAAGAAGFTALVWKLAAELTGRRST